ncbi:penicillin-binding protein 2 [Alkalilimnicola sp. S0819]|uniref:penicillin-binding protein 2 n=1 Tax=Alkalilimnicola sp. S0819 TaxID=2613922 RepID=UPI0012625357|nr:penicillin-binding protein 2 [Alkalilimnicola sp. S0819]KAB7623770.1 penicillin-binding protein 2 [Alkalilimnicola sp. S0819]MPQ16642.1 penicillin-binding protein 2 [Alkalilimnicola sp. S0819]
MARAPHIKDRREERGLFNRRALTAMALMFLLFLGLAGRAGYLQVFNYQHYTTLSQANRVKLVPAPPTRGLIFDREGRLLAENRPSFQLVITPEQVQDMDATLAELGRLIELSDAELERFHALRHRQRHFNEVPLKYRLSEEEVAHIAVNRHRLPGVDVRAQLTRHYPRGEVGAHAIGYVGRISERDLGRIDTGEYAGTSHIGKAGVERYYEDLLHGRVGTERLETNALGRTIRSLEREAPQPGKNLYLTLDIELQAIAEQALGEFDGAVIALDPRNGDLLAFASKPSFDPNLFVNGIDQATYEALQHGPGKPLFNRALRGQYPPASIIKPLIGLAGLEYGVTTPEQRTWCPGYYQLPGLDHRYRCWSSHGHTNMEEAIAESCDVYFYALSYELGIDRMSTFLAPFSFGAPTGVDLHGESAGILPSRAWKRANRNESWYHGETLITSIGQGFFLSTPLQLAASAATLANRGRPVTPRLLGGVRAPGEKTITQRPLDEPPGQAITPRAPGNWERIIEAMRLVVDGPRGTARRIGKAPYSIAGKTGTAQVFSLGQDEEYDAERLARRLHDHALFVGFAPVEDPQLVVAVIAEHGGGGSRTAAPIARQVMDAWLLEDGKLKEAADDR